MRKIKIDFFIPDNAVTEFWSSEDIMLFELAHKDLTKIDALRKIKKKVLWYRYYLMQVEKLNELIELVGMMGK